MKKRYYLIKERNRNNHKNTFTYYFKVENPHNPGAFAKRSTGLSNKAAAIKYTEEFLSNPNAYHTLFPSNRIESPEQKNILFKDFARDWWDWDKCSYVIARRNRSTPEHPRIKRSYTDPALARKKKYIIPYFGEMAITDIKEFHVENFYNWLLDMGLSRKTINDIRSNLNIMMEWARKNDMIRRNPVSNTLKFPVDKISRKLLTTEESSKLFNLSTINTVWNGNYKCYTAALLSFLTGMREGEILALKASSIFHCKSIDNDIFYIDVKHSYSDKYGLSTTKNSETRTIPISKSLYGMMLSIASQNQEKEGFIFSVTGEKPINSWSLRYFFSNALRKIGISQEERKRRTLTFHSLRASFVTNNRSYGVPDTKIAAISGHKTLSVLNTYTNFGNSDFLEINVLQEKIEEQITKNRS